MSEPGAARPMSDVRIKPCPFCGSHSVSIARTNLRACWVECEECGAHTDSDESRSGAILNWNRRKMDDNKPITIAYDQDYEFMEWCARHAEAVRKGEAVDDRP